MKKILKIYKDILDKKIKNSTFTVFLIIGIIFCSGIVIQNSPNSKANILAIQEKNNQIFKSIIIIN
jgi:hypothetical protein